MGGTLVAVAAVISMPSRVVSSSPGIAYIDVAGVAVVVVGHPTMVDSPVDRVVALPAPPVPVIERSIPVVVVVVASPTAVMVVGSVVGRGPPVTVRALKYAPVPGHVMDGVRIVVPVCIALVTEERSVTDEVVHAVLFVDRILVQVHRVPVGMQVVPFAPLVVFDGTGVLAPIFVERDGLVG